MICKYIFFAFLFVTVLWTVVIAGDDDDEEMCNCILLGIEDLLSCGGDWDNVPIALDVKMELAEGQEDMPDMVTLKGDVNVGAEVSDGFNININVNLQTPNGEELVWSGGADLCQSMQDTDAPWFPLVSIFNTTECPVKTDVYKVEGLSMNLDFAKGALTKDFCGDYMMAITVEHARDKIMCFKLGATIFEDQRPCSKCQNKSDDK